MFTYTWGNLTSNCIQRNVWNYITFTFIYETTCEFYESKTYFEKCKRLNIRLTIFYVFIIRFYDKVLFCFLLSEINIKILNI